MAGLFLVPAIHTCRPCPNAGFSRALDFGGVLESGWAWMAGTKQTPAMTVGGVGTRGHGLNASTALCDERRSYPRRPL